MAFNVRVGTLLCAAAVGVWWLASGGRAAAIGLTVDPAASYTLVGVASGKCVQPAGSSTASSAKAQIQPCDGSSTQRFQLQAAGAFYAIRNVNSGKCLDVQARSTAEGASIIQYTCSGATNQQWSVTDIGGGALRLTARHSGKVMEAYGSNANGTSVVQRTWASRTSQQFRLVVSGSDTGGGGTPGGDPGSPPPPGTTRITWLPSGPTLSSVETSESQGIAYDGRLWVFGGFVKPNLAATLAAAAFDPVTNHWTSLAPMPRKLTHAGQAVVGSTIYLAGGFVGDNPDDVSTNLVWQYNTIANTWSAAPSLPGPRGAGALVTLDGKLHFFGGALRQNRNDVEEYGDHWVLDPTDPQGTWQALAPMPNPRNHLGGAAAGGRIYALGGQHLGDENTNDVAEVDEYNPATNSWRPVASLAKPRGHLGPCTVERNGRIMVVSGVTMGSTPSTKTLLKDVDEYDPATNTWTSLTPLPDSRESPVAGAVGTTLIVVNGGGGQKRGPNTWLALLSP